MLSDSDSSSAPAADSDSLSGRLRRGFTPGHPRSDLMFSSWVYKIFNRQVKSVRRPRQLPARKATAGFRPGLESLEDRAVPAFLAPVSYTTGANPAGIAVGDFNGDGRDDMAVV